MPSLCDLVGQVDVLRKDGPADNLALFLGFKDDDQHVEYTKKETGSQCSSHIKDVTWVNLVVSITVHAVAFWTS